MVRLVLLANPTAALSALRLAITVRPLQRGSKYTSPSLLESASGEPARVVDATLRIESFEPLEGLDSLVELLQSPAGSVALSTVLGLEAKQEYAHGADLEAHSCLGPLLAALPCALSLKEHTRVSTDTIEETLAGTSIALPPERVPVAHRLAKMVTELKDPQAGLHRSGLMHKFEAYLKQVSRNRYAFVDLTHAALVKVCLSACPFSFPFHLPALATSLCVSDWRQIDAIATVFAITSPTSVTVAIHDVLHKGLTY